MDETHVDTEKTTMNLVVFKSKCSNVAHSWTQSNAKPFALRDFVIQHQNVPTEPLQLLKI